MYFGFFSTSWINQIERFFGLLTENQIRLGAFQSVDDLKQAITRFIYAHNQVPKPFQWIKSAEDILANIRRFCEGKLEIHSKVVRRTSESPYQ